MEEQPKVPKMNANEEETSSSIRARIMALESELVWFLRKFFLTE